MVPGIASADLATCQAEFDSLLGQYVTDSASNPPTQVVCVSPRGTAQVQALNAMLNCPEQDLVFDSRFVKGPMGLKQCQTTIYQRCKGITDYETQLTTDLAGGDAAKWKKFLQDEDPGGGCNAVQSLL